MLVRNFVCIASCVWAASAGSNVIKTDVAILGGGMTGIIAARSLVEHDVSNFVIVEARSELGGRMQQGVLGNGMKVEFGPNWIQGLGTGPSQNPIYTLALENALLSTFSDFNNISTFDNHGPVDMSDELNRFTNGWNSYLATAGARLAKQLGDLTARAGLSVSGYKPKSYKDDAAEYYTFDFEFAQPPEESSFLASAVNNNFTYQGFSAENNLVVDQRGFKIIAQSEAALFLNSSDPRLLLNHTVSNIRYTSDGVVIETANGVTIEAKHAICTFSIGVLQNQDVTFTPALPQWKQDAIEGMSMTTYTKIFLRFNTTFWSPTQYQIYADPSKRGYFPVWQSLDLPGFLPGSHILFATVTGHESVRIERQSDAETRAELLAVLRAMYGAHVPAPEEMLFKRWRADPLFRGSYSNWGPSYPPEVFDDLKAVVDGRLWFAGEATSYQYYGFLQGAYYEGLDVGTKVAKQLQCANCSASVTQDRGVVKECGRTFLDENKDVPRNPATFV